MKGIQKTLGAAVLVCSVLAAQVEVAHAKSPWGFGLKVGPSLGSARTNDGGKVIIDSGKEQDVKTILARQGSFWFFANLYGEYAFTDYIGVGLEAGYMKQNNQLAWKNNENNNSDRSSLILATHGISVPLSLCIYLMGREESDSIFKIQVGATAYFPIGKAIVKDAVREENFFDTLSDSEKKEAPKWDIGAHLGIEYEWNFGLLLAWRYTLGFRDRFGEKKKDAAQTILPLIQGLKGMKAHDIKFGIGYNFASLLTD